MASFDINRIIQEFNIDTQELSRVLFPLLKYPEIGMKRLLMGETDLSVTQLEKLASFIGVMPAHLFNLDSWKTNSENNCLTFEKDEFKVKLNYNNVFLTLYKNGIPVEERIGAPYMTLNEFLKYLDTLILKYKNDGTN